MTLNFRYAVLCSVLSLGLTAAVSAQAAVAKRDPMDGTWRLNLAKSTLKGPTASSSETLVFRVTPTEESFDTNAVQASDSAKEHSSYKAAYGGPPAPAASIYVLPNGAIGEIVQQLVQVTKIDEHTREKRVTNLAGVPGTRSRREISPDGKRLTSTIMNSSGKVIQVRVFDRVN